MMKTKYKKISVAVALLCITGIALAWKAKNIAAVKPAVKPARFAINAPLPYDHALLDTFNKVASLMNIKNKPGTYNGLVSITDDADSSRNLYRLPFLLCANGIQCFYRLGHTETINRDGFYIYIDHEQHTVLVGPQKPVSVIGIGGLADLKADMVSEHYALQKQVEGKVKTIRFINEHHISCREYSVSYDTASMKVRSMLVRLPDISYGLDTKKEKQISISFMNWTYTAELDKYTRVKDVIQVVNSEISLNNKYRSYQLIRIQ